MLNKMLNLIDSLVEVNKTFDQNKNTTYDFSTNTLNINFSETMDLFLEHVTQVHKCKFAYTYHPALWIVLHEIGHIKTENLITDDEWIEYSIIQRSLEFLSDEVLDFVGIDSIYYNHPVEFAATAWAINFIKRNKKHLKGFLI